MGSQNTRPEPTAGSISEQFQLLAQHAMVAAFGLFDLLQMVFELLLAEEGRAIEPLQLLPRGVALPIGPGHREQLEGPDGAGAGHVRAAAQVDELALAIERHGRLVGQPFFEVLHLERLPQIAAELRSPRRGPFDPLERLVFLDDLGPSRPRSAENLPRESGCSIWKS